MLAPSGQISDHVILGTPSYHAPEMVMEHEYSLSTDIYSLGITFVVLLHSSEILENNQYKRLLEDISLFKLRGFNGVRLYDNVIEPFMR